MGIKVDLKGVDLHTHTTASDGLYDPWKVVSLARQEGLAAVAITDHDTMAGIETALAAGADLGIQVVPGVEISAYHNQEEIHLLGYYPNNPDYLRQALQRVRNERFLRMEKMLDKLKSLRIPITLKEVIEEAGSAAPGRLHLARLMLKKRYINSLEEAFTLYLLPGKGAYVPRKSLTSAKAIDMLRQSGAIPVLAHPGTKGKNMLTELQQLGLRGIEVFHPDHTPELTDYYKKAALEAEMLITGGSDFHGDINFRVRRPGSISVADHHLEALQVAARLNR